MNCRYLKGSEHSPESVEFDTENTTCVVNVDLLLCGIRKFPCGDGSNKKLSTKECYDILKFVEQERGKFINKAGPKSMSDWENNGIASFSEFFFPGDLVTDDVYDHFLNILPPATMWKYLLQVGEPANHEIDNRTGKCRATYMSFSEANGRWLYVGECFLREVTDRTHPFRLASKISEIEKELKTEAEKK